MDQDRLSMLKAKYPNVPVHCLPILKKGKKKPTAQLTADIMDYCKTINAQPYRINSQGQFDPRTKKWRMSGMKRGQPDLTIIYLGRFIGCEIKASKNDKVSGFQQARHNEIIASGGFIIIARTIEQFKEEFQNIINQIKL